MTAQPSRWFMPEKPEPPARVILMPQEWAYPSPMMSRVYIFSAGRWWWLNPATKNFELCPDDPRSPYDQGMSLPVIAEAFRTVADAIRPLSPSASDRVTELAASLEAASPVSPAPVDAAPAPAETDTPGDVQTQADSVSTPVPVEAESAPTDTTEPAPEIPSGA